MNQSVYAPDSPVLVEHRRLNAKAARARRRMLACPCPFYVSRYRYCVREADLLTDALLMQLVPLAHDAQLYRLLLSLHIPLCPR